MTVVMRFTIILKSFPALLLILCLTSSCGKNNEKPTLAPPVKVTVLSIREGNIENNKEYSGTVSSSENTTVSFSVSGTITNLYVSEGDKVVKGQLLGKVRDGEFINARNIAEAQLAEAQDAYNRLKKLHDANALPEVKWVEMQQKLKQAQNAVEIADRTLKDTDLRSPVNGTVTKKYADVGQTVLPVEPIFEIVSTQQLTVDIPVTENEIGNFHTGQQASVIFDNSELGSFEGKVSQKSVVADPLTRSFTVKISISSPNGKILPGMLANVIFESFTLSGEDRSAFILPSQSVLLNEDNKSFVWIVKNNKAERRFVEVDELVADGVLVKSGLQSGDSVIIAGMQKVGTGTVVDAQIK